MFGHSVSLPKQTFRLVDDRIEELRPLVTRGSRTRSFHRRRGAMERA